MELIDANVVLAGWTLAMIFTIFRELGFFDQR